MNLSFLLVTTQEPEINFMEPSLCRTDQKLPFLLQNLKAHCYVHESLPLTLTISQMNAVCTHCISLRSIVILTLCLCLSPFLSEFLTKILLTEQKHEQ
jgi:hypothetical protein